MIKTGKILEDAQLLFEMCKEMHEPISFEVAIRIILEKEKISSLEDIAYSIDTIAAK